MAKAARTLRYNWDDIIFFLEVARSRNLVRAGQKLKVDHTTVSRRVRELERSLDTTLFRRSKSGFSLDRGGPAAAAVRGGDGEQRQRDRRGRRRLGADRRRRRGSHREHGRHRQHVPDGLHGRFQQALSVDPGRAHHRHAPSRHDPARSRCVRQLLPAEGEAAFGEEDRRVSGYFSMPRAPILRATARPRTSRISTPTASSISSTSTFSSRRTAGSPTSCARDTSYSAAPAWSRSTWRPRTA